ncbi:MAG: CcdB family protein [Betaproteobacteria bacterium]
MVIQSDLLYALPTRMTVPLAMFDADLKDPTGLNPITEVRGKRLLALAHYAAPLPAKLLRRPLTMWPHNRANWFRR